MHFFKSLPRTSLFEREKSEPLTTSELDLREVFDSSLVAIYVVQGGKVNYVNDAMARLLGYESALEVIGRPALEFTSPEDHSRYLEMHRLRLSGELKTASYTYRGQKKDGSSFPLLVTGGVVQFARSHESAVIGMAFDASQLVAAEHQGRLAGEVFRSAAEGIIITDKAFRIEAVNPAFTAITGYAEHESVGKISSLMTAKAVDPNLMSKIRATLVSSGHWEGEVMDRRKNGQWYPAWLSISAVCDDASDITNFVYIFTDNTRRKEIEERLRDLASRDSLTGLLNRSSLAHEIDTRLRASPMRSERMAVFFIDLDHFKGINDTLGHSSGDAVLKEMAKRMRRVLREDDFAARIGGDEFAIVFDALRSSADASDIARRITESLVEPVIVGDREVVVTSSIGWAIYPEDGTNGDELLRNADIAMYEAKRAGRNAFCHFSREMTHAAHRRVEIEHSIRFAMARNEFNLVYQPQCDLGTGKVHGVEALLRWKRGGEQVSPSEFIPIVEKSGQIDELGSWVIRHACRQLANWRSEGIALSHISVNVSPRQLLRVGLMPTIVAALAENRLEASALELEITESTFVDFQSEAIATLSRIRSLGVRIAIDDFGTGYSSFAALRHLPAQKIKIDRSFISALPHEVRDAAIVEGIITMARRMNLEVIAEGVESEEQRHFLDEAGCRLVQGYLTGRPVAPDELRPLLESGLTP